ncbi:MAG: hypothetical protein DWP92_03345 [Armatimonadetes bacterium]|nr:MAG: hypothetical protein DWP92_03345 [Armatimonadota bacterium]
MTRRTILALLLVLALVVAGCGGSGEDTPTTQGDEQPAPNGNSAPPAASNEGPVGTDANFPVPVPAGWEIDIYGELAEFGATVGPGVQVLYPADEFDGIVAFYDDWTTSQSTEYARTEAGDQILYVGMEEPIYWITVTANEEQRDRTWTLLQIVLASGG